MKKIYIFLASSITEFARERDQIELFIRNISDRFEEKYSIKIVPLRCENVDPAVGNSRKQDEYNDMIKESDMCFFIFFTKAGDYTVEEFRSAVSRFRETGKPKVYVYFKNLKNGETAEQSVIDFMEIVDKDFQHYYGCFDDVDTIKLRILLNLKFQEMDFLVVEFDEEKCIVDGTPLKQSEINIENVSEFANNKLLLDLRNQLKEVEELYFDLKPKYASGELNETERRKYVDVASKRQSLLEAIEEMQKNIFMLSMSLSKDAVHGEMTPRLKKAYQYFEQGDLDAALIVLDKDEIISEYQLRKERRQREQKQDAKLFIREIKTRINFLISDTKRESRFDEADELYRVIVKEAKENLTELVVIGDYASFLFDHNRIREATDMSLLLNSLYESNPDICDNYTYACLYNLLGSIMIDSAGKYKDAEQYFEKAISINETLYKTDPEKYAMDLARSYNNLAGYYMRQSKLTKAQVYSLKSVDVCEKMAELYPDRYKPYLSVCYNGLGYYYHQDQQPEKAEHYYLEALEIKESITNDSSDLYNSSLATIYNNLGAFYAEQGDLTESEKYHLKAVGIRELLVINDPERYYRDLVSSYNNIGYLYFKQKELEKAEHYYSEAIKICNELAKNNPEKFKGDLAISYSNIGLYFENSGNIEKAEHYYLNSEKYFRELVKHNPQRYNGFLVHCLHRLGELYYQQHCYQKAEKYYLDAKNMYEDLSRNMPEHYSDFLARCYFHIGVLYEKKHNLQKAEHYYLESMTLFEKISIENQSKYSSILEEIYNRLGSFYVNQGNRTKAKAFFQKTRLFAELMFVLDLPESDDKNDFS